MDLGLRGNATVLVAFGLILGSGAWSFADDTDPTHQLSLADLAKYRAALTRKAAADDAQASEPQAHVSFKDLWDRPDALRGRRVVIEGCLQRIFRQGPVGSFPALAEIWIASPEGDPFCLIVPQETGTDISPVSERDLKGRGPSQQIPKRGQTVRFTGTFLKMIRYAAGDGDRLAPLVVGDQLPVPVREAAKASRASSHSTDNDIGRWTESPTSWLVGLTLALLAVGVIARQHLRVPTRRRVAISLGRRDYSIGPDPPLVFIDSRDDP